MDLLNAALALTGTAVTVVGFVMNLEPATEKHRGLRSLLIRIKPIGWVFLALVLAALLLTLWKDRVSFEGQAKEMYPNFYQAVEDVTKYEPRMWNKYLSYRLSLRFLLQQVHRKTMNSPLPEGMAQSMKVLGEAGVLSEGLCQRLDVIRYYTYTVEWATYEGPTMDQLAEVREVAHGALDELRSLTTKGMPVPAVARPVTSCGCPPMQRPCQR